MSPEVQPPGSTRDTKSRCLRKLSQGKKEFIQTSLRPTINFTLHNRDGSSSARSANPVCCLSTDAREIEEVFRHRSVRSNKGRACCASQRVTTVQNSNELHCRNYLVRKLIRARRPAHIAGADLAFLKNFSHGVLDLICGGALFDVTQHQNCGLQKCSRVSDAFPGDVGSGAVHGFEHGAFLADVCPRH